MCYAVLVWDWKQVRIDYGSHFIKLPNITPTGVSVGNNDMKDTCNLMSAALMEINFANLSFHQVYL